SHRNDRFVAGALHGFGEYARLAGQQASDGITELDYAIECGQKSTTESTAFQIVPFIHLDKPGLREYLKQQHRKLARQLRVIMSSPQLQSLPALLQKHSKQQPMMQF
ncbi:unnamed protein product, partial [Rotaria sp. Silwood1]